MTESTDSFDRRIAWQPKPRPAWLAQFNGFENALDIKGIVPLDEESLLRTARANTGLDDFGDDIWIRHFRVLIDLVEKEAKLNFFGRILTRSDFLIYLEQRLRITDYYKRFPEIEDEVIKEPIFIIGFGRSGTTILHEVLSTDPQFRSVRRWEALFPCPPPEAATYETDPRAVRAQAWVDVTHAVTPEWQTMHAWGGQIPVEDPEFTYAAFFSEVWPFVFQIPSYEKYFATQDIDYEFWWHKRYLKLLQWKHRRSHWLLKAPTILPKIPDMLRHYPDARIILTHRDPVTSGDSVVGVLGTGYYWRTDDPWGGRVVDHWVMADKRAELWDHVIGQIESGTIPKGHYANFIYHDFMADPIKTIMKLYADLSLPATDETFARMRAFLDSRPVGGHGAAHKYKKHSAEEDAVAAAERAKYVRYQQYFKVPNEG
jgi:hypothetical protein